MDISLGGHHNQINGGMEHVQTNDKNNYNLNFCQMYLAKLIQCHIPKGFLDGSELIGSKKGK